MCLIHYKAVEVTVSSAITRSAGAVLGASLGLVYLLRSDLTGQPVALMVRSWKQEYVYSNHLHGATTDAAMPAATLLIVLSVDQRLANALLTLGRLPKGMHD